jgi:hypothetical protein
VIQLYQDSKSWTRDREEQRRRRVARQRPDEQQEEEQEQQQEDEEPGSSHGDAGDASEGPEQERLDERRRHYMHYGCALRMWSWHSILNYPARLLAALEERVPLPQAEELGGEDGEERQQESQGEGEQSEQPEQSEEEEEGPEEGDGSGEGGSSGSGEAEEEDGGSAAMQAAVEQLQRTYRLLKQVGEEWASKGAEPGSMQAEDEGPAVAEGDAEDLIRSRCDTYRGVRLALWLVERVLAARGAQQ